MPKEEPEYKGKDYGLTEEEEEELEEELYDDWF